MDRIHNVYKTNQTTPQYPTGEVETLNSEFYLHHQGMARGIVAFAELIHSHPTLRALPIHPSFCHIKHLGCNDEKLLPETELGRNNG